MLAHLFLQQLGQGPGLQVAAAKLVAQAMVPGSAGRKPMELNVVIGLDEHRRSHTFIAADDHRP